MKERIVRFEQGHDCIKFECKFDKDTCIPREGGSHGKHGLSIRFVLKGDKGAVQFLIYTGWLPQYAEGWAQISSIRDWGCGMMPADLGYHSKTPTYEGQTSMTESCEYCDGEPCYYDGSTLNASNAMYVLVNGGDEALWTYLEQYYEAIFNNGPDPVLVEYGKLPRRVRP
jgi:hypothetical protein